MNNNIHTLKTIKEVEDYRAQVNEACDERVKYINTLIKGSDLSKKSFGYIKECFETLSPKLFETKEGKKIIRNYIDFVKSNKNISSLHAIYENIRKSNKNTDVDFLIESITNQDWGINKNTLASDVESFGKILAEAYIYLGNEVDGMLPQEKEEFSNAVCYIAENKPSKKNLYEYSTAVKIIKENISKIESNEKLFESGNLDGIVEKMLNEFNEKYSSELTDEEKTALKELSLSENREEVFNKYKDSCRNKIEEARNIFVSNGDKSSSDRLSRVLEQISTKTYCKETVGDDVCNLIGLSNIF
jgi:hypothetical protein